MIVRYGGGNDGIVDYLINGRKAERHTTAQARRDGGADRGP